MKNLKNDFSIIRFKRQKKLNLYWTNANNCSSVFPNDVKSL